MIETAQRPEETFEQFLDRLDAMIIDAPLKPTTRADADSVLYAPRPEVPTAEQIRMQSMCRGPVIMPAFASVGPLAELGS